MKQQRNPFVEKELLNNCKILSLGVHYAESTLKARWPEWEDAVLAMDAYPPPMIFGAIAVYAQNLIKRRWSEVEPLLLNATTGKYGNEDFAVDYAEGVIQGRWPELETIILEGNCWPAISVDYARRIKKTRWPEMERVLLAHPPNEYLYNALVAYAADVISGRWIQAENIILAQPSDEDTAWAVYLYSRDVVRGRWPRGEPILQACTYATLHYADDVLKDRLPDNLHNALVLGPHDEHVRDYMEKYGKPRA